MAKFVDEVHEWFDVPGDKEGAKAKIKYLTAGQEQELELKAMQVSGSVQPGESAEVFFDINKKRQLIVTQTVVDWSGFLGKKGNEMKCTERNLLKALSEFDWFFDFVEESRAKLRDKTKGKEVDAGKN